MWGRGEGGVSVGRETLVREGLVWGERLVREGLEWGRERDW